MLNISAECFTFDFLSLVIVKSLVKLEMPQTREDQ